jgi:hypothetical protein
MAIKFLTDGQKDVCLHPKCDCAPVGNTEIVGFASSNSHQRAAPSRVC